MKITSTTLRHNKIPSVTLQKFILGYQNSWTSRGTVCTSYNYLKQQKSSRQLWHWTKSIFERSTQYRCLEVGQCFRCNEMKKRRIYNVGYVKCLQRKEKSEHNKQHIRTFNFACMKLSVEKNNLTSYHISSSINILYRGAKDT